MSLNPFKKDLAKKTKTAQLKEVRAQAKADIRNIKKIADPVERVKQYEVVNEELEKFYDGGKPQLASSIKNQGDAAGYGTIADFGAAWVIGFITVPLATVPVGLAIVASGAAMGAAGTGGVATLWRGRHERKRLREEYGSIRNARAMHKLQNEVKAKALKDMKELGPFEHIAKLRDEANDACKKQSAVAEAAVPVQKKIVQRVTVKGQKS